MSSGRGDESDSAFISIYGGRIKEEEEEEEEKKKHHKASSWMPDESVCPSATPDGGAERHRRAERRMGRGIAIAHVHFPCVSE